MSRTRLSVNINKIATLRNARGGSVPDVVLAAMKCQEFGAQGITVHPRPDERHIRYQDVRDLRPVITSEFNIEGYPSRIFIDLVLEVRPHQVTLVPDSHDVITSNQGWNVIKYEAFLKPVIREFQQAGIRTSLFIDTDETQIEYAAATGPLNCIRSRLHGFFPSILKKRLLLMSGQHIRQWKRDWKSMLVMI
jgi:pyridoxine 5-phosphate synthase